MEKEFGCANPKIISYTENTFHPEDEILKEVRERSIKEGLPPIQLGKMDARHLEVLTRACAAKKAVEIGTLGGYSGIAILRGMEEGARLWTFELKSKNAQVARESFQKAGFKESSEVIEGRAIENLSSIESHGPFGFVFVDANKAG
jgi:caffeoyl-CoA O-methyltransferase